MRNYDWTPDRRLTPYDDNFKECIICDASAPYDQDICYYCELEIAIKKVEDANYYVIKKADKETIVKKTKQIISDLALGFAAWVVAVTVSIIAWTLIL